MEPSKDAIKKMLQRWFRDWCRCGGKGYWHEQIDGPDNLRLVRCERHWKGDPK